MYTFPLCPWMYSLLTVELCLWTISTRGMNRAIRTKYGIGCMGKKQHGSEYNCLFKNGRHTAFNIRLKNSGWGLVGNSRKYVLKNREHTDYLRQLITMCTFGKRYSPGISTSAVAREKLLRNRHLSSRRNDLEGMIKTVSIVMYTSLTVNV